MNSPSKDSSNTLSRAQIQALEASRTNTNERQAEMYEHVELKQDRFSIWSVIGIHFSITAAPLAILTYVGLVTGVGGMSYFFWCYVVALVGQLLLAASLAEIAAILPHSSGQILWAGTLAPRKMAHFLSYLTGAFTTLGWILGFAGACVYTSSFLVSFGVVVTNTYVPALYQFYLLAVAAILAAFVLNTAGVRLLPGINRFMVIFLNAAAFYIFVALLVKTSPKNTAYDAFVKVTNQTGWSSDSFVFLLGFLPGLLTMSVPDAASHMAEEVPSPERTVPLVMIATSCLNATGGLCMLIAIIFCTARPEDLLVPSAGQPAIQLVMDAWENRGWVVTVVIILTILNGNAAVALLTGGSRLLWAFARTGGLPFGSFFGCTHASLQVPVVAIGSASVFAVMLALLVLGPSTVLNGIFGCSIVCLNVSYMVPICFMAKTRRSSLPKTRHFNLGRVGQPINVLALTWLALVQVAVCLPTYYPVTSSNMNWTPATFLGLAVAVLVNWFAVRKGYRIPKPIYVEQLHGWQAGGRYDSTQR